MLMTLRRRQGRQDKPAREPGPDRAAASQDAATALAGQADGAGRQAAELEARIGDLVAGSAGQARAMQTLAAEIDGLALANGSMAEVASDAQARISQARASVGRVADSVEGVVNALREVAAAAQEITQIALQTRLVAFNASVEAQRAGEAGRAFTVVADVVKDLAAKVERSSRVIEITVTQLDRRVGELTVEIADDAGQRRQSQFHQALAQIETGVAEIARAGHGCRPASVLAAEQARALALDAERMTLSLAGAHEIAHRFVAVSAGLAELAVETGQQTDDTRHVEAVTEAAQRISGLFGEAVRSGAVQIADLFDEGYVPVPGTDPQQHTTRFVAFAERVLPAVQQTLLRLSESVVFCAAVDRNGYLPVRSVNPAGTPGRGAGGAARLLGDRRLLDGRIALAAGRNERRFLLQTYSCDAGSGKRVLMRDLSVPIRIDGRLWGGLRLGYLA